MVPNDSNQEAYTKDNKKKNKGLGDTQEKTVVPLSGAGLSCAVTGTTRKEDGSQAEQKRVRVATADSVRNQAYHYEA